MNRFRTHLLSLCVVVLACACAKGQVSTTTSLTITASPAAVSSVQQGAVVTLTATVNAGTAAVSPGQVEICDASAAYCTGTHLLGTFSLTPAGTAQLKFRPGLGKRSYKAVFLGTKLALASTSDAAPLNVTGNVLGTTAGLVATGAPGNYTLTATVYGSAAGAPKGKISFQDSTNSNYVLGTATLTGQSIAWSPVNLPMPGANATPYVVALGDYNGDGILDMAVTDNSLNQIVIWIGKGDGTFQQGQTIATATKPSAVVEADFNGDGKLDLMVGLPTQNGGLGLLLGNGDGTFQQPTVISSGNYPQSLAVGDFNGDGRLDVVAADNDDETLAILLGNGDGSFLQPTLLPINGDASLVLVADLNGDGTPDLLVATQYPNYSIYELLGKGGGAFTQPSFLFQQFEVPPLNPIATGDFNDDGKIDIALPAYTTVLDPYVLLGNGDGTFTLAPTVTSGFVSESVAVGDFNGDGIQDIAAGAGIPGTTNYAVALLGSGDGTFVQAPEAPTGKESGYIAVGDLNGDGLSDAVVANSTTGNLTILLSKATATATVNNISPVGTGTHLADAVYGGDANYAASTSNQVPLTAELQPTSLALTASSTTSTLGQSVTLTATLTPSTAQDHTASESVTFLSNGTSVGSASVANGVASLAVTTLPAGNDSLTAMYAGDTNFATSTSSVVSHTTNAGEQQTITFPQPAGTQYAGTSVYLNATVSSGLPITYTVISGPANVSGSVLSYTGQGKVVVEADQSGNATYAAATPVQITLSAVLLAAPIGGTSAVVSTVVTFATSGTLGDIGVFLQGASHLDFSGAPGGSCALGTAYAAGQTCTVDFVFTPTRPGLRYGGITLLTTSAVTLGSNYIYGLGMGPQIVFTPATQSVVGSSNLGAPDGVAIDGNGNLFVADNGGTVGLSEVTAAGAVISFQALGLGGCYDVTVDGNGNAFVITNSGNSVSELEAVDGSVPASPVVRTIADIGTIPQTLDGLKVDNSGDLFLAGASGSVYEIVAVNGSIPASPTILTVATITGSQPSGVALDASGDIFVSDGSGAIEEIVAVDGTIPQSPTIRTIRGSQLGAPSNIGVDAVGDLFVSDDSHNTLEEVLAVNGVVPETNPTIVTVGTNLGNSQGLVLDPSGVIYIASPLPAAAIKLDYTRAPVLTFAATPLGSTSSDSPQAVTLQNDGNEDLTFTGNNPTISPGFTLTNASTCPQTKAGGSGGTLGAGDICTESIAFTPVALGPDNGTLDITDDYLNSSGATQIVLLQGIGLPGPPTIVFNVPNKVLGDPPFTVAATSNSTGPFTYSVVSGPATISGNLVTLTGAGSVTLLASEAVAGNYAAGTATATFTVAKKPQIITFNPLASPIQFSATPIPLIATATSGLPVTFSIFSGPGSVNGTTLSVTGISTVTVAANQSGDATYAPAPQVTQSVTVTGDLLGVTLTGAPNPVFLNNAVTLTTAVSGAPVQPTGTVTYFEGATVLGTAAIGNTGAAALAISTLSLGTHTFYATYNGDSNFLSGTSNTVLITVEDFSLTVANPDVTIIHGGTATYSLLVTSVGGTNTASNISFALSGGPENSNIGFTPATLPINSTAQTVSLVIQTPDYPVGPWSLLTTKSTASLAVLLAGVFLLPFRKRARRFISVAVLCVALNALNGCGSGWRTQVWPMQVTATAGNLSHVARLNLTSVCKDGAQSCPVLPQN